VRALALPGPLLSLIAPLLAVMRPLNRRLAYSDATIEHVVSHGFDGVGERECRLGRGSTAAA
jgi:hypothetical protein